MTRTVIATAKAPKTPPQYSQAISAAGLVFVSGTLPLDPATGAIVGATIQEQTAQCLRNISAILEAAGTSLKNADQPAGPAHFNCPDRRTARPCGLIPGPVPESGLQEACVFRLPAPEATAF